MPEAAAYGWRVDGAEGDPWLAVEGAAGWPLLTVARTTDRAPFEQPGHLVRAALTADGAHADLPLAPADMLAHPLLATAAIRLARARGDLALHGGALVGAAGAWLILGAKEAGKSSLLATAALVGATVLGDDIAIVRDGDVLGGPRLVDLRPDSAAALPAPTDPVRGGTRQRLRLGPAPARTPLAGIVYLAWGERAEVVPLPPAERLRRLAAAPQERATGDPAAVLELAALPTVELRRPRRLAGAATAARVLLDAIGG